MKRMFIAAMAIAALVSCSKDDSAQGPALDSQNKSVSITIENALPAGRAADFTGGETAAQEVGKVAEATSLKVLFAEASGKIVKELSLTDKTTTTDNSHDGIAAEGYTPAPDNGTDGVYTWHNVPWSVTRVAVVRYEDGDFDTTVGLDLEDDIQDAAKDEEINVARPTSTIILYGEGELEHTDETHRVGEVIYHIWETSVTVEPLLARFEIDRVYCQDLGTHPDEDGSEYSFDELDILSMVWTAAGQNGKTYDVPVTKTIVRGKNEDGSDKVTPIVGTLKSELVGEGDEQTTTMVKPTTGVWSWNINPETTQFGSMVVDMNAYAYNYQLDDNNTPLSITKLAANEDGTGDITFEKGNVYKLSIDFLEENITDDDKLCVRVTVTIADWAVKTVYPVFGN